MKILLMMLIVLMGSTAFAFTELDEMRESLKEINKPEAKAKITKFILKNKNASQRDVKRMRVLDRASEIIYYELSKKYDAKPENYEQKINNKEDRELFKITLGNNRKRAVRGFLLCKGNYDEARKGSHRSWELRQQMKELDDNSDKAIAIREQMLEECKYDDAAIWGLLATYRYKEYREKYNKIMLGIIQEDQVEFDYSGSFDEDMTSEFKLECLDFLAIVNSLNKKLILTKDQVELVGEAALTKHAPAFDLKGVQDPERALDVVLPLVTLSTWMEHYRLKDLQKRFTDKFFVSAVIIDTLKTYSDIRGFKEHIDYLQKKGLLKTE
mgnify:FL=1